MPIGVLPVGAGGGGGGNSTGFGPYAARAALTPVKGDQYFSTEDLPAAPTGQAVYDGSEWRPIIAGIPCRKVDLSILNTWVNQAPFPPNPQPAATATQYGDAALINFPNVGGNAYYTARVQLRNDKTEVIGCCRVISNQQGNPQPVGGVILGNYATGLALVAYSFGYSSPASFTGGASFNNPFSAAASANNSTNGISGPIFVRAAAVDMGGGRIDGVTYAGPTPNGPWLEIFRAFNLFNSNPVSMVGVYGNGYNCELNAVYEHFEAR